MRLLKWKNPFAKIKQAFFFFFPEKEKNKKLTKQTNVWQETQKIKKKTKHHNLAIATT